MESLVKISIQRIINPNEDIETNCCVKCGFYLSSWFLCLNCQKKTCEECKSLAKVCLSCNYSSKYMKKVIDQSKSIHNLIFKCIYYEKGCTGKINGLQLINHQSICLFQPFQCPNEGCNSENLLLKDKVIHEELCLFQPIPCPECKMPVLRNELELHKSKDCFSNNSSCILCKKEIPKNDCVKHHEENHKKVEKCEKCHGNIKPNHDCILEMSKQLSSSRRKQSIDLKDAIEKNEDLTQEIKSTTQFFEEYKLNVESKISNISNSLNSNVQNFTNLISNLQKEVQELNNYHQNIHQEVNESLIELKSLHSSDGNKLQDEIKQFSENVNLMIENSNKDLNKRIKEQISLFNSDIQNNAEKSKKNFEEMKEKIYNQENKVKELYQDLERFQGSSAQDFYQKIESVEKDNDSKLMEIKENSKKLSEEIKKIKDIFQPLSEINLKRLKQNSKAICYFKYIDEEYYSSPKEKEKNKFLFYVERRMEQENDALHINNLEINKHFKIDLYKNFNYMNDAVFHNADIFYCGGGFGNNNFLDYCAKVSIEKQTVDLSKRLKEKKCFVSLVSTPKSVYCLGGFNGVSLNSCEIFNSANEEWTNNTVKLNKSQDRVTSFFYCPSTIYTFGSTDHDFIEKHEIYSGELVFEPLKIKCPTRAYGCAFAISHKKILLFGGDSLSPEFYIFNPFKTTLKMQKEKFCENTNFNSSKPVYFNGMIMVISESEKKMFQISPENFKFEIKSIEF